MTHTTMSAVAQSNDNTIAHPQLISFLMNQALQTQLGKQQQQKSYVSALVDVTVQVIASIWPNSISSPHAGNHKPIADLNTFLHHILKHSRTTHSTLQLAIFYLFRIRSRVQEKKNDDAYVSCGRRMFLAALISAHKYLQDKTYKNSAWSKVSGLNVQEINHAEKVMLQLLDYRLFVNKNTYDQWILMLQTHLKVNSFTFYGHEHQVQIQKQQQQQQQEKLNLLKKAQQSLPSPPLDDASYLPESPKKRKHCFSDEKQIKKTCL
ncbi:cyclin-domain-containing protein [Gilbertella persicaria]|uniref:cyclin-domain-containing protein n=1 Tax=Gilbertella persicaria TaxID=101096 RepID=UPI002220A3C2|nr:cyclin-domain-containing protein [Gilbertella persicaria]KAI8067653.1 cyclin-domain-containing protein [Gilbertella persicaria]